MKKILIPFMLLIIVIGGCSAINDSNQSEKNNSINENNEEENEKYDPNHYAPIQEYTGEGYTLEGASEETGEIANEHREEVDKAVKDFFQKEYKTEVKIHNIVSAVDGVSVYVESVGDLHFYTYAIVPIDVKNKEIKFQEVWSQEGRVEDAIAGSLYAIAFEEDFSNLDKYMDGLVEDYPIIGTNIKTIENVKGNGYTTPYYFISTFDDTFKELAESYINNTNMSEEELVDILKKKSLHSDDLKIAIEFYMDEKSLDPDKEIYDKIYKDIEGMEDIPKGEYFISLHDNYVMVEVASGKKDNTIRETIRDGILK